MLKRAAIIGFALAFLGCTERVILNDVFSDAGGPDQGSDSDMALDAQPTLCDVSQPIFYFQQGVQLLILLDRSLAMQNFFEGTTRMKAVQDALVKAISKYQKRVKIGFEQFPVDASMKSAVNCQHGSCCAEITTIHPGYNLGKSLSYGINCGSPSSFNTCPYPELDSPSHNALSEARNYFMYDYTSPYTTFDENRYILLITASDPSCSGDTTESCNTARNATVDLGNMGVRLIILNLGNPPDPGSCLSLLSLQTDSLPEPVQPLYTPANQTDLTSYVDGVIAVIARTACTFNSIFELPDKPPLDISIGFSRVPQVEKSSNEAGWYYDNNNQTRIVFTGHFCEDFLLSPLDKPDVTYSCSNCGGSPPCFH